MIFSRFLDYNTIVVKDIAARKKIADTMMPERVTFPLRRSDCDLSHQFFIKIKNLMRKLELFSAMRVC